MITIVIDAGHGGFDNGARYQDRKEKDDNLRLALAVGKILEQQGYDVIYTRTTDIYQSPYEKAQIANDAGADYFISFHRNSGENDNTYHGVQTLIYGGDEQAERLAGSINTELEKAGFKNLGIEERTGLVVLRRTEMPAVLIEAGFINNDKDNEIFDNNFEEIASAIALGIERAIPPEHTARAQQEDETPQQADREDIQKPMPENTERDIECKREECTDRNINNRIDQNTDQNRTGNIENDRNMTQTDDRIFGVEVGRFLYRTTANFMAEQLVDQGFTSYVLEEDGILHVVVGKEHTLDEAVALKKQLRDLGYQTMIVAAKNTD